MLHRVMLLRILLSVVKSISDPLLQLVTDSSTGLARMIDRINAQEFVFFTKGDNVAALNQVMRYVSENEHTHRIKIATVLPAGVEVSEGLRRDV